MMYVWNGFTIVGKRADLTESLLVAIESAEEKLRSDPRETAAHSKHSCQTQNPVPEA